MQLQLITAIIVAILTVVFALQNTIPITVSFLTWNFKSSLALVLLITLTLGILMSLLVSAPSMIKKKRIISSQKKKIQELENNLQKKMENGVEEKIKKKESELPLE